MSIQTITAQQAYERYNTDAIFIDIRSVNEYNASHITNAIHIPVDEMTAEKFAHYQNKPIIFYCRSGMRTKMAQSKLNLLVSQNGYILNGGISAWNKASYPVKIGEKQPMEITRQVHIIAGILILLGIILGKVWSDGFYWLSFFVGAGLTFSGLTGFCGMAKLLLRMPWNKTK